MLKLNNQVFKKFDKVISGSIISVEKIGKNTAKLICSNVRPLTKSEISRLVASHTENKLKPYLDSITTYQNNNSFISSVCCYKNQKVYLQKSNHNKLTKVHANSYLDVSLNQTWTKQEKDGQVVFFRENNEDIEALLSTIQANILNTPVRTAHKNQIIEKGIYAHIFTFSKNKPNLILAKIEDVSNNHVVIDIDGLKATIPISAVNRTYPSAKSKDDVIDHMMLTEPDPSVNPEYYARLRRTAK